MDSFSERLRSLAQNKYFAYVTVIFFAFLTAVIFALFAYQNTLKPQTSDDIRTSVTTSGENGTNSPSLPSDTVFTGTAGSKDSGQAAGPARVDSAGANSAVQQPSIVDRIISAITGKSLPQPTQTPSSPAGTTEGQPSASALEEKELEGYRKVFGEARKAPRITIGKHVLTTQLPETPQSLKAYQLKNTFTDGDIRQLAAKLGFTSVDAVEKKTTLSQLYDLGNQHYLGFDMKTGEFSYISEKGFAPSQASSNARQTAKTVLADIGYDDPTIRAYATYQRSDEPGFIFVELHRDWDVMGAPIMNPIGMLNLTQAQRLDSVSIASQPDNYVEDTHITATSDNTDGHARPASFNTATVKLSVTDNRVYALSSNLPQIRSSEVLAADMIKTPIDAFHEYESGRTSFGLTAPSGEGSVNLADVYSNDLAASPVVDVTDFELMYASAQTGNPEWWCPVYALRSFGKVQTGFDVQFAHSVPASRDPRCQTAVLGATSRNLLAQTTPPTPTPDTFKVVPTVITGGVGASSSLQYGTIGFKAETIVETGNNECPANFNHSFPIAETSEYSDFIAWIDLNVGFRNPYIGSGRRKILLPPEDQSGKGRDNFVPRQWYFVRKAHPGASLEALNPKYTGAELFNLRTKAMNLSSIGNPSVAPLDPKISNLETVSCQHITTGSPWVHVYAPQPTIFAVNLAPVGGVAYVSPHFTSSTDAKWSFAADKSGSLTFENGLIKDGLFWEYYRHEVMAAYTDFTATHPQPKDGFIVATSQLQSFMKGLVARMGLTTTEQAHVVAELNRESMQFASPFVKIRFVSQNFLSTALPLMVNPLPESMNRIYFELSAADTFEKVSQPMLPLISRIGTTVVETGFIVNN